jgi:AraC-like DNA-binding protein
MPRFRIRTRAVAHELVAQRVACDGCDPVRPCAEHAGHAALWFVSIGAFELRDAAGRHALDPTRLFVMPAGNEFVIRHFAGPDTCVAFHGPLVDRLVAERGAGAPFIPLAPAHNAALGEVSDLLAIAEQLALLTRTHAAPPPDRDLAAACADELRLHYTTNQETSLLALAERVGYSPFHVCHAFRAATGQTLHGFRRELRLRHALARLLDGDESLTEIAARTGFASQSHLTNRFRSRFGITPARARTRAGRQAISAATPIA